MKRSLPVLVLLLAISFSCDRTKDGVPIIPVGNDADQVAQQILYQQLVLKESFRIGEVKIKKDVNYALLQEKAKNVNLNNDAEAIAFYGSFIDNPVRYASLVNDLRAKCREYVLLKKDLQKMDKQTMRSSLSRTFKNQFVNAEAAFSKSLKGKSDMKTMDGWGPTSILGPDSGVWTYGGTLPVGSYESLEQSAPNPGGLNGGGQSSIPDAAFQQYGICSAALNVGLYACSETLGIELCIAELAVMTGGGAVAGILGGAAALLLYQVCRNEQIQNFDVCLIGAGFYKH